MGLIQSLICSVMFCLERVLTWVCFAFVLIFLMGMMMILMVYGISVGYHYAQKELASFANHILPKLMYVLAIANLIKCVLCFIIKVFSCMLANFCVSILAACQLEVTSRTTTPSPGKMLRSGDESKPVVRLLAVNRSSIDNAPRPMLEVYQNRAPPEKIVLERPATPIVLLETESPPPEPELLPHERDLAKRLIGRFRRSKNNTITTDIPFLRPFKATIRSDVLKQGTLLTDPSNDQNDVSRTI